MSSSIISPTARVFADGEQMLPKITISGVCERKKSNGTLCSGGRTGSDSSNRNFRKLISIFFYKLFSNITLSYFKNALVKLLEICADIIFRLEMNYQKSKILKITFQKNLQIFNIFFKCLRKVL